MIMAWIQDIYDTLYDPDTICVACISHGKDSEAMLRAIQLLGLPLHRIIHTEVWATDTIPADLPPMVEFKKEAEKIIKELYGIEVENVWATQKEQFPILESRKRQVESHAKQDVEYLQSVNVEREDDLIESLFQGNMQAQSRDSQWSKDLGVKSSSMKKLTYQDIFYRQFKEGRKGRERVRIPHNAEQVLYGGTQEYTDSRCNEGTGVQAPSSHFYGFPISINRGQWCQQLKRFSESPVREGRKINIVQYLGIAADEHKRIKKHIDKPNIILPLVEIGWEEGLCGLIAKYQGLLSPIYTTSMRGGCWFCHNQSIGQLRILRRDYPDLWQLLLKWDKDSPVTFKPDGHTVHDFDKRFALEDAGMILPSDPWKWGYLNDIPLQLKINF